MRFHYVGSNKRVFWVNRNIPVCLSVFNQSINQSIIYFDMLRRGARKLRIFIWTCINKIYNNYSYLWVTFLAETSKDLEIILITIVRSFTNSLSRTSLYFSLKTSFVYSNLFSLAKTVTIRCYIQTSKRVRSLSSACKKARATA